MRQAWRRQSDGRYTNGVDPSTAARRALKRKRKFLCLLCGIGLLGVVALRSAQGIGDDESLLQLSLFKNRVLSSASTEECTGNGWNVFGYVVGILVAFNGLAILCDEFFQASLEKISDVLHLTPDVAGATFLAAGSSAPELFTSLADAFGPSNSIGMGTIVGSAMFNILVIVALSAAVASKNGGSLAIDYRPVARDVSFYTASILLLGTMFADSLVTWWESLILVLLYVLYVIFMVYNSRILGKCKAPAGARDQIVPIEDHIDSLEKAEAEIPTAGLIASEARRLSLQAPTQDPVVPLQQGQLSLRAQRRCSRATRQSLLAKRRSSMEGNPAQDVLDHAHAAAAAHSAENNQEVHKDIPSVDPEEAAVVPEAPKNDKAHSSDAYLASLPEKEANVEKLSEDENEGSPMLKFPDGNLDRLMFLFSLPFFIAFGLTVPNCGNSKYERYYAVTFAMSIAWIGLLSHFMVDFATKIACILSISPIIMGELVLAVGTSLPDAIGSMIAARNGEADMAIANAVGSNVFDIDLGLGFPWLLRAIVYDESMPVDKDGILVTLIILFCTVILFVGVLMASGWRMTKQVGVGLFSIYCGFVTYRIIDAVG